MKEVKGEARNREGREGGRGEKGEKGEKRDRRGKRKEWGRENEIDIHIFSGWREQSRGK